jgi:general secretion pathway protein K
MIARLKIISSDQRGAALISVILVMGLFAFLVTSFSLFVSNKATSLAVTRDRLTQNALVQSALEFGMGRVLSTSKGLPIEGDDRIRLQIGEAHITWRGESGRLDINLADETVIASLLTSLGLSSGDAKRLASLIGIRRSGDMTKPLPAEYQSLSNKKRGPFAHIRELLDVPGMTAQIYQRLEPFVTVYGRSMGIDPRLADSKLIEALPDMSRPIVAELNALRGAKDEDLKSKLTSLGPIARFFDVTRPSTTRFEIEIKNTQGGLHIYDIVTIHFGDDMKPYQILSWREVTGRATLNP